MNTPDQAAFGPDYYPEPERTSLAAIFGFILSLMGCCLVVPALLGVPLSIFAIVSTSRSRGRLGGRGLAIAGLLIGLFSLVVYVGCLGSGYAGINAGLGEIRPNTERFFAAIESDDFDAARPNVVAPATDVSDAELLAFREAYQSTLGDFQSLPDNTIDYFAQFFALGPIAQAAGNAQNAANGKTIFPIPATFDAGPALIMFTLDQSSGAISHILIVDTSSNEYELPMPAGWDSAQPEPDPADSADETGNPDPSEGP